MGLQLPQKQCINEFALSYIPQYDEVSGIHNYFKCSL